MKNFFDYFEESEEYPENIAERGIPQNTLYTYVSVSLLNGFINYVKPFFVCVMERYVDWRKINLVEWDAKAKEFHPDYAGIDDDIMLLAESDNDYWFFWSDRDVSDCCIGRFNKSKITKEEIKKSLIEWITQHEYLERGEHTESIVGNYHELPLPEGWVVF